MKKFWNFSAKANNEGELTLYGDISSTSWFGDEITPKQFKSDLDALGEVNTLKIYINSGGGDVFAGQAIYSMLKRHKSSKTVYIDGLAASIASVIAMVGDKIIMPKNAMMMIHKGWTITMGNANDCRQMADVLDKIDIGISGAYEEKTGKAQDEILNLMEAETWMTADEAMEMGFADEVQQERKIAASINGNFLTFNGVEVDAGHFKNLDTDKIDTSFDPKEMYAKLLKINERRYTL